jgi:glycosyltransferase involved in cell wall biosynthesis
MVAYHFPPLAGSSGIQRTLRFVQHLPQFGWEAVVLSASPRAYERVSDDLVPEIPPGTVVRRAFALDTARHLAIGGRYPGALARPDRWQTWRLGAAREGRRMLRELRPDALWSTYPIATAHLIGADLQACSGLPWVADFRDPMAQEGYPADPATWRQFQRIEQTALRQARYAVFTTPGAARTYRQRYPQWADKVRTIENGYDEESFPPLAAPRHREPGPRVLLHSGIVYPSERDPTALFDALARLRQDGLAHPGMLQLRFRAAVHDELIIALATQRGVADFIEVAPAIPYRAALAEMQQVDALLVLQAANCNDQIPAKLYEYLRAGRPIIALTDPAGDTASVLQAAGVDTIANLSEAAAIAELFRRVLPALQVDAAPVASPDSVRAASRRERAHDLANLLDAAITAGAESGN